MINWLIAFLALLLVVVTTGLSARYHNAHPVVKPHVAQICHHDGFGMLCRDLKFQQDI